MKGMGGLTGWSLTKDVDGFHGGRQGDNTTDAGGEDDTAKGEEQNQA